MRLLEQKRDRVRYLTRFAVFMLMLLIMGRVGVAVPLTWTFQNVTWQQEYDNQTHAILNYPSVTGSVVPISPFLGLTKS